MLQIDSPMAGAAKRVAAPVPFGYIDLANAAEVHGWAVDWEQPGERVSVVITIDDNLVARVLADEFRQDLRDAGIGDGRHGFAVLLGDSVDRLKTCVLHARRESDGRDLPGSPVTLHPATRLDEITKRHIKSFFGSACDDAEGQARLAFLSEQMTALLRERSYRRSRRSERLLRKQHAWRWSATNELGAPALDEALTLRALVIDLTMPAAQRDAGSNAVMSHIQALQRLGYEVTLAAADMSAPGDGDGLDAAGIYWCGPPWHASVEEVLRREAGGFDVVYLHRVSVALRYSALVRHFIPRARLIYSVADLHFLRLARQAKAEERPELLVASQQSQAAELTVARSAEAVITHSSLEAALLRRLLPEANIHTVPWSIPQRPTGVTFGERRGVAFIANYAHPPNLDAALWLVEEIMPNVLQLDPTIECFLVGRAMPDLLRGRRFGIVPLGDVPDLAEVFARVRLTVAPVAYGAGVRGKVLESFAAGVPCVCTPIAAEGLDLPAFLQALVGSDTQELAGIIHRLHTDIDFNAKCAQLAQAFTGEQWSDEALDERMRGVLGFSAVIPQGRRGELT